MDEARLFITEEEAKDLIGKSEVVRTCDWDKDSYYRNGEEVIRIRYTDGKKLIITGTGMDKTKVEDENAEQTLSEKGFEAWVVIKRSDGSVRVVDGNEFFIEKLDALGWSVEIEAQNKNEVVKIAEGLGFAEANLQWHPLLELYRDGVK